ncbi:hypothetical protein [Actinokineospora cianjurensis]|uniref:Uncharacterized protein n=1 Tax=Actinokineospora cianjurensis TaxID=585224 RepID=A0A421AVA1_9PSEU|nr:hypothetical protein [Actinokineospora cianjurensis]RLK53938.1 hypothetical protein CLV68_6317 [Actinokineospora cianjurensis]
MLKIVRVGVVGVVLPVGFLGAGWGGAALSVGAGWVVVPTVLVTVVVGVVALRGILTMFVGGVREGSDVEGLVWVSGFLMFLAVVFGGVLGVPGWVAMSGSQLTRCEVVSVDDGAVVDGGDGVYTVYRHVVACPGGYPTTYEVDERYVDTVELLVDPERETSPEYLRGDAFSAALGAWVALPAAGLLLLISLGRAIYWFRTSGPSSREPAPRS